MAIKILFQGDSITDAGRDKSDPHQMGTGYPRYASELIRANFPATDFEFFNLGISGNRSENLLRRVEPDLVDLQPALVSILIGINDVWHRHNDENPIPTTDEQFEANYRRILETVKEKTEAKILMIEPYLLQVPDKRSMRPEVLRIIEICRALGHEYADAYLPLDGLFAAAEIEQKQPNVYSKDGVHPNLTGAQFIAEQYLRTATPLIQKL